VSDIVYIRGLRADAVIGVYEWERHIRQTLVIDLEMRFSTRAAAASDALPDALDYHAVATRVREMVEGNTLQLIEGLAEGIAATLIAEFGISWLRLKLAKPGAVPWAEEVGVVIERGVAATR
jgi:dihydroneopterin aldolase